MQKSILQKAFSGKLAIDNEIHMKFPVVSLKFPYISIYRKKRKASAYIFLPQETKSERNSLLVYYGKKMYTEISVQFQEISCGFDDL